MRNRKIFLSYVLNNKLIVKYDNFCKNGFNGNNSFVVQALIFVLAIVFDLAQLTCQKRFDCRIEIMRSSAKRLGTSYSQFVVAVLLQDFIFERDYAK